MKIKLLNMLKKVRLIFLHLKMELMQNLKIPAATYVDLPEAYNQETKSQTKALMSGKFPDSNQPGANQSVSNSSGDSQSIANSSGANQPVSNSSGDSQSIANSSGELFSSNHSGGKRKKTMKSKHSKKKK